MFIDTSIPSPAALAYLLRNPEHDPVGFTFNYFSCNSCAMGLARRVWTDKIGFEGPEDAAGETAKLIGIDKDYARRIFTLRNPQENGVSREAIAKDLEALVEA